jgi:hypothetical protein
MRPSPLGLRYFHAVLTATRSVLIPECSNTLLSAARAICAYLDLPGSDRDRSAAHQTPALARPACTPAAISTALAANADNDTLCRYDADLDAGCWHGRVVALALSPWPRVSLTQGAGFSRTISAFSAVANTVHPT